ncbi:LysR family transcriptional regulator [Streptomyces sp. N2-109]|uniref:LysR family transcriptional regulator n=1 Tax=Streptomyces gossypii TaxID=2883101 RepID=A0ABT2JY99_9ACTN|nr:LysR family transcriptional regulator [Streptomyces gossypii]MCT2592873.1 LysR family transcriptional regulator [Streptomyces gossypii]
MLDVRRMQVLRAVVTSGSVTAAAADLGYTPSAVSQQVAALEKEAGAALLERVGRGVRPTAAGRLLTEHAAGIGERVAEAEAALADLLAGRTGRLSVHYFATAGATLVAPALARLRRTHPGVRIELRLSDPADPLSAVKQGRADLATVVRPHGRPAPGVRLIHLLDDPYRAVLPRGHRLAAREVIDLAELADEPWVATEWPAGPCLETILDACATAGFTPHFAVQSEDCTTALGFVAAGLGISLVPRVALGPAGDAGTGNRNGTGTGVVVLPVRGPEPHRTIHAAVRETAPPQPALHTLLNALRETAAP